jgi:AhpD family alkylhydroperoxidase
MPPRINYAEAFPEGQKAMYGFAKAVHQSGLEHSLIQLVLTRASQINGCAWCLNMHTRDAIKAGEQPRRLHLLHAWRETPLYSERERAALALTESMTLIAKTRQVPDDVYDAAAAQFNELVLAALMLTIVEINTWNRLAITAEKSPVLDQTLPG